MRGNAYDDAEDLQEAIKNYDRAYDRAIELRPDDPKGYFNRASFGWCGKITKEPNQI